jgi:EmrB/QacA subfamily drug resistance transporter
MRHLRELEISMVTSAVSQHPSEHRHAGQPPSSSPPSRRWLGLAVLAVAQFMVVLDATIVNIALPDIGTRLHIGQASLAWIITAYVIAFGGLLPLGGRLADLLGRRRVFVVGVSIFAAASLAAGLAQNAAMLIGTRAVQGAGAALMAPAALALVTAMFPAAAERAKALSIWGAVTAGGAAAGVLFGGLLTGGLGWRSVFLINVPIGAAVLATVAAVVSESRSQLTGRLSASRLDLPGAAAVTAGLVALVASLSEGDSWGWASGATLTGFAAAAGLLGLFLTIESRTPHPLVPLRLFRIRTVSTGNLAMLATGAAMFGLFYFLSLDEQIVLGYGPIRTGLSQLPLAAALVVAATATAPLLARLGSRMVLTGALLVLAGGLGWLSTASAHAGFTVDLLGPTLLIGLGLGAAFVAVTNVAVAGVPTDDAGVAGGLVNTSQQVGGAIGLAALVAVAAATSNAAGSAMAKMAALNYGYSWAFLAAAAIAVLAAAVTAAGVRRTDGVEPVKT